MIRILSVVLLVSLAGCAGATGFGNEVAIAGQGQKNGVETKDLDCGTKGQVAVGFQGEGNIDVKITDGAGAIIYTKSFNGGGQAGETKTLSGAEGNWKIAVTFSGLYGGYQGQYGLYLRC